MPMYVERQSFTKIWIWLLLFLALGVSLYMTYEEQSLFNFIGIAILLLVMGLMFILRLHVSVSPDGIRYAFFPFVKEHLMPWSMIKSVELIKYSPIRDFGGWGFRFNRSSGTKAYTTKGDIGLLINNNFLLGINNPNELKEFLRKYPEFADKIQVTI